MEETRLASEPAQKALDAICGWLAPALRPRQGQRIAWLAGLIAKGKGLAEVDRGCVIEAGKFVLHPGYAPLFANLEGTGPDRQASKALYLNLQAYYASPRTVKRWDIAGAKPAKPAAEMKVLGITSSTRPGSNSTALVLEALRGAAGLGAATDVVHLTHQHIGHCVLNLVQRDYFGAKQAIPGLALSMCSESRDCTGEEHRGVCAMQDSMAGIYPRLAAADALIVGFPIYNGWEPAVLATFLERWARYEGCLFPTAKPLRRAMLVATWGYNDPDCYRHIIENLMTKLHMRRFEVVEALAACNIAGMLSGLDENGEAIIKRFPGEMGKAFDAGKTLVTGVR